MSQYTNEPPENLDEFLRQLKLYLDRIYSKGDKLQIIKLLRGSTIDIIKTGNWGKITGHAEAEATFFIDSDNIGLVSSPIKENLREITFKILQSLNCGLEVIKIDFVPKFGNATKAVEEELVEIIESTKQIDNGISLPQDLISKGKEMSEAYLYIYFVENTLRLFVEQVQSQHTIAFPQEVMKTILKNKSNEAQSKFLPLRANNELYYCDFVQLHQIISNNWEIFKSYFPQKDQHWLRVKIEDMYRVRNLIAHCGYISHEELQMVKSNFIMILRQLKV